MARKYLSNKKEAIKMKKNYQYPKIKILILSGRKLMDDNWEIGGTIVDVQGAKGNSGLGFDENEDNNSNKFNVWDY